MNRTASTAGARWIVLPLAVAVAASLSAQAPPELIVRNGIIVTAVGRVASDLRIRNGTIAEIGRNLTAGVGGRVIEAKGMLVLPGGVDPHVHLTPIRTATTAKGADDYTSASRTALRTADRRGDSASTRAGKSLSQAFQTTTLRIAVKNESLMSKSRPFLDRLGELVI